MTNLIESPPDLPPGLVFDSVVGLYAEGLVARDIPHHLVLPRPTKPLAACTFDRLGNNTTLGMHLAHIVGGGTKCNHRHFDETTALIVSGSGWSEFKQDDDADPIRVEWRSGDILVIPSNAWHVHHNNSPTEPARQLSFRNTPYLDRVLRGGKTKYHPKDAVYNQSSRFYDRFADEPDYFSRTTELAPGWVQVNHVRDTLAQALPADDPRLGDGVAMVHYVMGGQRTLDLALVGIKPGGAIRPYRSLCEEAAYVLEGAGQITLWTEGGPSWSTDWRAGDLLAAPLNTWRHYQNNGQEPARLLIARNIALPRAMGIEYPEGLDLVVPDRLESLLSSGTGIR